jgi:hypothetical protein
VEKAFQNGREPLAARNIPIAALACVARLDVASSRVIMAEQ